MGGNSITATRGCAEFHQVKASWKEYDAKSWRKLYNQVQRELSKVSPGKRKVRENGEQHEDAGASDIVKSSPSKYPCYDSNNHLN